MSTNKDLGRIIWQPQPQRAIDVARSLRRPTLAKLDWGLYGKHPAGASLGVGEELFVLHSRQCSTRVTASNMVSRDGGYVEAGPGLAVPVGYQGWFRILHEAGQRCRQIPACQNIIELCSAGATSFLSCEDISGFQIRTKGGDFHRKLFPGGSVFSIQGAYIERASVSCCCTVFQKRSAKSIKYLKCRIKCETFEILLPLDSKGIFWPIWNSEEQQYTGCVFQISQLLDTVRETQGCIVELVHGMPPPNHEQFNRVLKLQDVVKQEVIVGCRFQDTRTHPVLLEFPVHSLVSFFLATNGTDQKILQETIDFVARNLGQYMNCMKVVTTMVVRSTNQVYNQTQTHDDMESQESGSFTDYDTIPCDDPVYENNDENFLQQTAQRLRDELAARLSRDYMPPCSTKYADNKGSTDSFLVTSFNDIPGTRKKNSRSIEPAIEKQQDLEDFLDDMFDCDVMSSSSLSGAVLVSPDTNHEEENSHSSISSLYKKVKQPPNGRRSDSGFSDALKCSVCAAGSDVTWRPPAELASMSVEEVARSLTYIGLKTALVERFTEEQIDGHQLQEITEDLLRQAFPQMNGLDIKKLMDFKAGWRPKRDH